VKVVSGKRMCRILEEHGWKCVRIKGSHHAFQKPGHPITIIIPVHGNRDLKPGILRAIMKDAALSEGDL
jgi:predicted RNA binding protein YcfA (HicA-like mRNA interferase family)